MGSPAVPPSDQALGQPCPAVQEEGEAVTANSVPTAENAASENRDVTAASEVSSLGAAISDSDAKSMTATAERAVTTTSVATEDSADMADSVDQSDSSVLPAASRVVCLKCMRTFVSARNLRDHMNIVHADHVSVQGNGYFKTF